MVTCAVTGSHMEMILATDAMSIMIFGPRSRDSDENDIGIDTQQRCSCSCTVHKEQGTRNCIDLSSSLHQELVYRTRRRRLRGQFVRACNRAAHISDSQNHSDCLRMSMCKSLRN